MNAKSIRSKKSDFQLIVIVYPIVYFYHMIDCLYKDND
ncbi:uncharacterized protein METZ01_LOCUS147464 [marine metagenome]|uniref:Uncharacterized protein n=1 Tax=marine metagenome TaxID=408172 RepID=A0A381ZZE0_9ZZZZ